ncbi:MAG: hypothetical protein EON52_01245 [Actinomycetales bacterium]|nr:MAG: hypothetical protein EON52_01245 [Actinomycetales bacterium]
MSGRARNIRSLTVVAALVVATLVGAAPAPAAEPQPTVRTTADGSTTLRDPALSDEDTRTVEGVLREVVTEGASDQAPVITTDDGDVIPVDLGTEVPQSDAPVTAELVEGPALDAALDGRAAAPVQVESARVGTAAVAAAVTSHRAYVAVVTNSGSSNLEPSPTLEAGVDRGLAYWATESEGAISSFTRPAATVRFRSSLDATRRCGFTGADALWNEAARRFPAVDFNASGNHLVVIVSDGCSGTGLGTFGSSLASGGLVTMAQTPSVFPMTIAHELGHNVGLDHANFCAAGCSAPSEYWNLYSVMGLAVAGGTAYEPASLDSVYRSQLGVTTPGEVGVVSAGQSVTRSLASRGSVSGLRALKVKAGTTTYWVEWRDGTGRDAASFYAAADGQGIGGRSFPDGVTVTRRTAGTRSSALMARSTRSGSYQGGQSFKAGPVTVRVDSIGTSAVVTTTVLRTFTTKTPTIVGVRMVGRTLRASTGTWSPTPTLSFQWYADGKAISRATRSTITLTRAQKGKRITVWVTGRRSGYLTVKRGSARTGTIG